MAEVVFTPAALSEYRSALVWYAARSRQAAEGFERAVGRVLTTIQATPERFPLYDEVHREAVLTKYPYSIVYRVTTNSTIQVLALAHASREPGYWHG